MVPGHIWLLSDRAKLPYGVVQFLGARSNQRAQVTGLKWDPAESPSAVERYVALRRGRRCEARLPQPKAKVKGVREPDQVIAFKLSRVTLLDPIDSQPVQPCRSLVTAEKPSGASSSWSWSVFVRFTS